jgi:hypothetical protein
VGRKRRYTFTIEPDVLDKMTSIADRTGVSKSEQIRRGIRWWLESHEWPLADAHADALGAGGSSSARRKRRQEI